MSTIYAIHAPFAERLEKVTAQMQTLGAPVIRVVDCGDYYMALEGSHRIAAAHALEMEPTLAVIAQDDEIDISEFDWFDSANWDRTTYTGAEVAAELFSPQQARAYRFDR